MGIARDWQCIDGARNLLVNGKGASLAVAATKAKRHVVTEEGAVTDSVVGPVPKPEEPQNLCVEKGYDIKEARKVNRIEAISRMPSRMKPRNV